MSEQYVTVAELAAALLALPAELQDKPVSVYSDSDEGGDVVGPQAFSERSDYIVVQRADDEETLLYHKSDNPVEWRHIPVLVTIIG